MTRERQRRWLDADLTTAVADCETKGEILDRLGLRVCGGNYKTLDRHLKRLGLDVSHYNTGQAGYRKRKQPQSIRLPLKDVLVENGNLSSYALKKRLLQEGLLTNQCSRCGLSEWQGERLAIHLDHINGVHDDNRLENLRMLCPNCHSLTPTYCGRNKRVPRPACAECGKVVYKAAKYCLDCIPRHRVREHPVKRPLIIGPCPNCGGAKSEHATCCFKCAMLLRRDTKTKIVWPTAEELEALVTRLPLTKVGLQLGVSDAAVKDRCQRLGIHLPGRRGYVQKASGV